MLLLFVWCVYQSINSSQPNNTKKKPGEGDGLSPDKVGGIYVLFHSHNIVGCLASIGDSDKMIHIPKEGTFVLLIVTIVPNDLYGRFLFSSFIFLQHHR